MTSERKLLGHIVLIILCVLGIMFNLTSCQSKKTKRTYNTHILKPLFSKEYVKLSDLFCDFEFIPLESNDDAFVSDVVKMKKVDNCFFIYDEGGRPSIKVFGTHGNYIRQIGRMGNAKEEYPFISDVTFNSKTKQTVVLTQGNKVKIFLDSGKYQKEWQLNESLDLRTIDSYKDVYVCTTSHFGTEGSQNVLIFYDEDFNIINTQIEKLQYDFHKPSFVRNGLQFQKGKFCFYDFFQSKFFLGSLNNCSVTDCYVLDTPHMVQSSDLYDETFYVNPSKFDFVMSEFYFDDYLYGAVSYNGKLSSLVINFKEEKAEIGTYCDWYPTLYDYDGEYLYSAIAADQIIELLDENSYIPKSTRDVLIKALPFSREKLTQRDNFLVLKMKIKQ